MKKYKLSELVEDFNLYPRQRVDDQHAGYMASSLRAGVKLPPMVIDKKTKQIIDGFHRKKAYRIVYGDDVEVECVEKTYKTDADRFADAMRYNSSHGRTLTVADRTRCAIIGERLGMTVEQIAGALCVDEKYVGELVVDRTATVGKELTPLKRTFKGFAGKKLTQRQAETNRRSSGMDQKFYVNQLIDMLEADMVSWDDVMVTRCRKLSELLDKSLAAVGRIRGRAGPGNARRGMARQGCPWRGESRQGKEFIHPRKRNSPHDPNRPHPHTPTHPTSPPPSPRLRRAVHHHAGRHQRPARTYRLSRPAGGAD